MPVHRTGFTTWQLFSSALLPISYAELKLLVVLIHRSCISLQIMQKIWYSRGDEISHGGKLLMKNVLKGSDHLQNVFMCKKNRNHSDAKPVHCM